jgi:hypothetical protein
VEAWYYARNGQQHGPVSKEELEALMAQGSVKPSDYVWTQGMAAWERASRAAALGGASTPEPPPDAPALPDEIEAVAPVPNYLPWAIAVTLCCCMPGGVASIVYAAQANAAWRGGRVEDAQKAADKARLWLIFSAVVGVVVNVIWTGITVLPLFLARP